MRRIEKRYAIVTVITSSFYRSDLTSRGGDYQMLVLIYLQNAVWQSSFPLCTIELG